MIIASGDLADLGRALAMMRIAAGRSQAGLARTLGLTRVTIWHRERGFRHVPALALIEHVRALGYDVAFVPRGQA